MKSNKTTITLTAVAAGTLAAFMLTCLVLFVRDLWETLVSEQGIESAVLFAVLFVGSAGVLSVLIRDWINSNLVELPAIPPAEHPLYTPSDQEPGSFPPIVTQIGQAIQEAGEINSDCPIWVSPGLFFFLESNGWKSRYAGAGVSLYLFGHPVIARTDLTWAKDEFEFLIGKDEPGDKPLRSNSVD